ncbi:MAG: hypothetical protein BRC26_01765 [Nanohaloarchaea archaeon QH_8_44_6]|nr:MAG: hypothetical protein BRC26_01765 [Nanohaloarchaea archaeon QH_8_44_6]
MITLSTKRSLRQSISQNNDTMVASFQSNRVPWTLYAPIETTENEISLNGQATLNTRRGRAQIGCVLTEDGMKTYNTSSQQTAQYCIAEHPYYNLERGMQGQTQSRAVLVPREIADSTLVRLYLMNGHGIDYAEPVQEGSNGYVKMWEVNLDESS